MDRFTVLTCCFPRFHLSFQNEISMIPCCRMPADSRDPATKKRFCPRRSESEAYNKQRHNPAFKKAGAYPSGKRTADSSRHRAHRTLRGRPVQTGRQVSRLADRHTLKPSHPGPKDREDSDILSEHSPFTVTRSYRILTCFPFHRTIPDPCPRHPTPAVSYSVFDREPADGPPFLLSL